MTAVGKSGDPYCRGWRWAGGLGSKNRRFHKSDRKSKNKQ